MAKITESIVKRIRAIKDPGSRGHKRSEEWSEVRNKFIKEHPECAACGERNMKKLEVHHIQSFSRRPDLELDPSNLIVLCRKGRNHHLEIGHGNNFKLENIKIVEDSKYYRDMLKRIKKECE